jgi:hypothetical protein
VVHPVGAVERKLNYAVVGDDAADLPYSDRKHYSPFPCMHYMVDIHYTASWMLCMGRMPAQLAVGPVA